MQSLSKILTSAKQKKNFNIPTSPELSFVFCFSGAVVAVADVFVDVIAVGSCFSGAVIAVVIGVLEPSGLGSYFEEAVVVAAAVFGALEPSGLGLYFEDPSDDVVGFAFGRLAEVKL